MKLAYQAYDQSGRTVNDVIDAASTREATESLRRQGLFVTTIHAAGDAAGNHSDAVKAKRFGAGSRLKNLAMFTRQLYVLSSTGTQLTEALNALERQTRDAYWKKIIADLRQHVEEGNPLSMGMARHPTYFDEVYRSLIAAGESGGKLSPMLDRLSQLTTKQLKTRSALIGSLVYPALLLCISGIVLVAMLTLVLPRFTVLFDTMDMELPPTTQALVFLSDAIINYWWAILLGIAATGVGIWQYFRTTTGIRLLHTISIRIPMFGAMVRGFITARMIRLLGVLMNSYVPLLDALELTKASAGNFHYERMIDNASDSVMRGESMSDAFADQTLITPSVYEAVRSGEATGEVSTMLLNMADFMDEENEVVLKTLTSILEPLILVGLGVVVGSVAISLFLPLFDLTAQAGAG